MFAKSTVLLVFVSAIYARQISTSENVSDVIDDLLKRLEDAIDDSIDTAKSILDVVKSDVKKYAIGDEIEYAKSFNATRRIYKERLDALKGRAKNASVDADECFGQDEKILMHLPDLCAHEQVTCFEAYVMKALDNIDEVLSTIEKFADDITEVKKKIENCKGDKKCLNEVAAKIEKDIIETPKKITKKVAEVVGIVITLWPQSVQCGSDALVKLEKLGPKYLDKITQCVNNKIEH